MREADSASAQIADALLAIEAAANAGAAAGIPWASWASLGAGILGVVLGWYAKRRNAP